MFNFQGSELIIILLLALVVLGPEKLPDAMRRLGRFYADLKKMSSGFQEEFRAAVDEPTRELRETANTLRDSVDFRKFADGERAEKPKSAEMTSAETTAPETTSADTPASETPGNDRPDSDTRADGLAPADPEAVPTDQVPFREQDDGGSGDGDSVDGEPEQGADGAPDTDRHAAFVNQTSTPPPPPAPFSSSQSISAAPRPRPGTTPQVAVEDEHGLREARPVDEDGAA